MLPCHNQPPVAKPHAVCTGAQRPVVNFSTEFEDRLASQCAHRENMLHRHRSISSVRDLSLAIVCKSAADQDVVFSRSWPCLALQEMSLPHAGAALLVTVKVWPRPFWLFLACVWLTILTIIRGVVVSLGLPFAIGFVPLCAFVPRVPSSAHSVSMLDRVQVVRRSRMWARDLLALPAAPLEAVKTQRRMGPIPLMDRWWM